jgi:hypothetical protein
MLIPQSQGNALEWFGTTYVGPQSSFPENLKCEADLPRVRGIRKGSTQGDPVRLNLGNRPRLKEAVLMALRGGSDQTAGEPQRRNDRSLSGGRSSLIAQIVSREHYGW